MGPSIRETEIKLRFESPAEALRRVDSLGARPTRAREFEDNIVWDDAEGALKRSGRLLRLRRTGSRYVLTYKEKTGEDVRYKVRLEHETALESFEGARSILEHLGYRPVYRYQKYRTRYRLEEVEICIDETPIGCFVELEGPGEAIDALASRLGFEPSSYITATYRELHARHSGADEPIGDLLLVDPGESPAP